MQGWHGWDDYAPFYDWENARTVGRRDVPFWRGLVGRVGGPVLELGLWHRPPLGSGGSLRWIGSSGIDRSAPMLKRLQTRMRRARLGGRATLVRGDIRALPFRKRFRFNLVMAPYGMLQSLLPRRRPARPPWNRWPLCFRAAECSVSIWSPTCCGGRSTNVG